MNRIRVATVLITGMLAVWSSLTLAGQAPVEGAMEARLKQVREVDNAEVTLLVATITKDPRFEALRQVAEERGFTLAPDRAAGRDFPEGYRAIFVPALDSEGKEQGFLVTSEEVWALSLSLSVGTLRVPEGFIAKSDGSGEVAVEVGSMTKPEKPEKAIISQAPTKAACEYVKSTAFSYGCFALPDNVYGQYYTPIRRWGTNPNRYTVAWRACYRGSIHTCPVNEAPGSPLSWAVCGSPPSHPRG